MSCANRSDYMPNGPETHYTWDTPTPDGRVIGQQEAGGLARSYGYEVDHTLVTDSLGREERYHFVDQGPGQRWTAHTRADGSRIEYRYDRAGRKIATVDPLGHAAQIERDASGQVIGLTAPDGSRTTIERDALDRRIDKTVHHPNGTTATTHYGWDGDRIVREDTKQQRTTVIFEPGSFVPMLRIDETHDPQGNQNTQLSTYITDALGTPLQLLTPSGQPRWLAEPDDWAAVKNQRAVPNVTQPIRFQGQWHDEESGLYYNRHRYYDPEQGRYISQDPIGLNGGTNLYGYVTNPIGMVDPLGLNPRAIVTAAQTAEKVRNVGWCIGQDVALNNSRDQLPDILEEEMDAAKRERAGRIRGCESDRFNREALTGTPSAGDYNACVDRAERNYQERAIEVAQRNAARHAAIDEGTKENVLSCVMPNPGDLDIPDQSPRKR